MCEERPMETRGRLLAEHAQLRERIKELEAEVKQLNRDKQKLILEAVSRENGDLGLYDMPEEP